MSISRTHAHTQGESIIKYSRSGSLISIFDFQILVMFLARAVFPFFSDIQNEIATLRVNVKRNTWRNLTVEKESSEKSMLSLRI